MGGSRAGHFRGPGGPHTSRRSRSAAAGLGATENPPGDERVGSAWAVPEIKGYLTEVEAHFVEFNTCAYQTERVRWFKPGKWAGRLEGLPSLSRVCRCPNWVRHESLSGKSKTERAAAYPKALCDAMVVEVFKKSLALEFWRYQMRG